MRASAARYADRQYGYFTVTMTQNELKQMAGEAALAYVRPNEIIGVGTGSTVNYFIAGLTKGSIPVKGAVSSSKASAQLLARAGIPLLDLNDVEGFDIYVDGADEINPAFQMIKGGGGALTREKIVAAVARRFICIADEGKYVPILGKFPLPVEVIPMAKNYVAREIAQFGGEPQLREGFTTDNGNLILDIHGLSIAEPLALERELNQITGVVTCGIFARRPADVLLLAAPTGLKTLTRGG